MCVISKVWAYLCSSVRCMFCSSVAWLRFVNRCVCVLCSCGGVFFFVLIRAVVFVVDMYFFVYAVDVCLFVLCPVDVCYVLCFLCRRVLFLVRILLVFLRPAQQIIIFDWAMTTTTHSGADEEETAVAAHVRAVLEQSERTDHLRFIDAELRQPFELDIPDVFIPYLSTCLMNYIFISNIDLSIISTCNEQLNNNKYKSKYKLWNK